MGSCRPARLLKENIVAYGERASRHGHDSQRHLCSRPARRLARPVHRRKRAYGSMSSRQRRAAMWRPVAVPAAAAGEEARPSTTENVRELHALMK